MDKCPNGHVLDPTWGGECPYCKAQQKSSEASPPLEVMQSDSARSRTQIGGGGWSGGRPTKVDDASAGLSAQPADTRRICGVLMTYSWVPWGQGFFLREGKNRIGRSSGDCEIQVEDRTMSGEHALILCRHGRVELVDLNSSNGTFVGKDMQMVSTQAVPLESGAVIKAGDTVFEFLKFTPDPNAAGANPEQRASSQVPSDPPVSPRDTGTGVR